MCRDYVYYRTRWGMTGSADYQINPGSDISLRGLYSAFRNWGTNGSPRSTPATFSSTARTGAVPTWLSEPVSVGASTFNANSILWNVEVGAPASPSGSGSARYSGWAIPISTAITTKDAASVNRGSGRRPEQAGSPGDDGPSLVLERALAHREVRLEATHVDTTSFDENSGTLSFKVNSDYLDVLPSASVRFSVDKDSDLRLVYGRGLARPDPQDLTAAVGQPDITTTPGTVSVGNPKLKSEYANNYDVLYERFLNHVGLIQAGYFYKDLSDPIVTIQTLTNNYPYNLGSPTLVSQPSNAGGAYVQGVEVGFQQRLSYLPGVLRGAGINANYSYTSSQANGVDPLRTDSPALLRQAPNSWNISPTFDTRHFSMRVGMTYDGAMIYAYQYENLSYATDDNGNPIVVNGVQQTVPNPQVGGTAGPAGDNYLYSHFQFDTQASYRLPWGFEVYGYGLNLNNEVFGFYNGGPQYVVQREYYHPTYAGGVRWTLHHE